MPDEKKELTVKQFKKDQKEDTSWKKEPWIGKDGFEYRANRVQNEDGTYSVINVRIGTYPIKPPQEGV